MISFSVYLQICDTWHEPPFKNIAYNLENETAYWTSWLQRLSFLSLIPSAFTVKVLVTDTNAKSFQQVSQ